ncbi:5681_t:CDS:2, partial [Paraglomus occultum]
HITAVSIVNQVIEEEPWFPKEDLRPLIYNAIASIKNLHEESIRNSMRFRLSLMTLSKGCVAFEILIWRDRTKRRPLRRLNETKLNLEIQKPVKYLVASQKLYGGMEGSTPLRIRDVCNEFVMSYNNIMYDEVTIEFSHGSWIESEEILEIVWRNPAFGEKFAKSQSEGTYVTDIIVPVVKASLKKLPIKSFAFVSTAERQSIASKDRREKTGKRPDIMFMKEENDWVKLWREMNDGMYWVHKGCKPKKDEFGIQVAGQKLHLYSG